ncbi:MAG: uracil-DNA glycosylase [Desulfuromonas sp.]|nr:MAG: uracil-DNA glycosylase [Desulfuromonas sp.]
MLGADLPGLTGCRRCPRLAEYREGVEPKRGRTSDHYWNRPVPGFGDPEARICLVGLAPGAHGANRTGRPFTGDGAGDFMYPLLHRAGLSNQPEVTAADDGLELNDLYLTNAVKCVPPGNKPLAVEFHSCLPYLAEELKSLPHLQVVIALGGDAFRSMLRLYASQGHVTRMAEYPFGHNRLYRFRGAPTLVASYHTSRYNIQTGRLTERMFLDVLDQVRECV